MAKVVERPRKYKYATDLEALQARMKRIEGQARGIQKMLEEGRYCVDIIQQLNALSSATDEVALLLLRNHVEGCVADAIKENRGEGAISELMDVVRRTVRR